MTNVPSLQLSPTGLALLKSREGLRLHAYGDIGGVRTIGYGHTGTNFPDTITEEEAENLLSDDLEIVHNMLAATVTVNLLQCKYDALTSFVFNIGGKAWRYSHVLTFINAHIPDNATMARLMLFNHVDGKMSPALSNRRASERNQFLGLPL